MENFEEKIWRKTFLEYVWLGKEKGKQMMELKCFLPEPTKIFYLQNGEKTEWRLMGCLVCVFKQPFSVFKQLCTYFHTFFYSHVFSQIFSNNNFRFLNTYTKPALIFSSSTKIPMRPCLYYFILFLPWQLAVSNVALLFF